MNVVRARHIGQFPTEGIASDITLGPQDTSTIQSGADNFPMYYDPGLILAEQGIQTPAPAPVPQPPDTTGQTGFLPWQMNITPVIGASAQPPAPGSISPAPRVNVPTSAQFFGPYGGPLNKTVLGFPVGVWLAIGMGVLVLAAPSGRRRR